MAMDGAGPDVVDRGVAAIKALFDGPFPRTALILGSGLGRFADQLRNVTDIAYGAIPGFPVPTVAGHQGSLRVGQASGHIIACMRGRLHAYEGHAASALAVPVRILRRLGVERLIITNAAGGLKPDKIAGSLMIVDDHINFSGQNPLIGPNDDAVGPRFFDMSRAYDAELRKRLGDAARQAGVAVSSGVYLYALGPSFETPAEVRMFAALGADAVGMSTVPECLAAVHCGMKVAALSVITNLGAGLSAQPLSHEETLAEAAHSYDRVEKLLLQFFSALAQ